MRFPSPLIRGTLVKKHRRSIVDVRLEDGSVVTAHCPTMGIMNTVPDTPRPVMLSDSGLDARRHKLTWELIDIDGNWVGVNSAVPRKVLVESIAEGLILRTAASRSRNCFRVAASAICLTTLGRYSTTSTRWRTWPRCPYTRLTNDSPPWPSSLLTV